MTARLKLLFHAAVGAFLLLQAGTAWAACDLKIKDLRKVSFQGYGGRGYEVFDHRQYAKTVEFTVENKNGACNFFVGFSAGGSTFGARKLTSGGRALTYQLYRGASAADVLKDYPIAASEEVLSGAVGPGERSVTFQFVFLIPFEQMVPPGTFSDSVVVSAYEGTVQSATLHDQKSLDLSTEVLPTAEFCLGDTIAFEAGYRNSCVDFGRLEAGKVQELMMHVRANTGFRMTFRSQNGGVLQSLDPRDDSRVPYRFMIDGREVSLGGNQSVTGLQGAGLTSAFGNPHRLRFIIGDLKDASAGDYQDIIELTLYPQR